MVTFTSGSITILQFSPCFHFEFAAQKEAHLRNKIKTKPQPFGARHKRDSGDRPDRLPKPRSLRPEPRTQQEFLKDKKLGI